MYCDKYEFDQRLKLVEGFARKSKLNGILPIEISSMCLNFKDDAVYWTIDSQKLLLNNQQIINQTVFQIGLVSFKLYLQNQNENILFKLEATITRNNDNNYDNDDYNMYYEFYCLQTQTQFKQTLYQNSSKTEIIEWSDKCLNIKQFKDKFMKLTFAVHIKQLSNTLTMDNILNCQYKWDLTKYLNIQIDKNSKIFSPNFGYNCWCLWFSTKGRNCNNYNNKNKNGQQQSICIGIQLLNLPSSLKQNGILFKCIMEYGYNDNHDNNHNNNDKLQYEFTYFLNLHQYMVEIGSISRKTKWIKMQINPIIIKDEEEETSDDDEETDNSENEKNVREIIKPSSDFTQDWFFRE